MNVVLCAWAFILLLYNFDLTHAHKKKIVRLIVPQKVKYIHHTHVLILRPKSPKFREEILEEVPYRSEVLPGRGKSFLRYSLPYYAESQQVSYSLPSGDFNEFDGGFNPEVPKESLVGPKYRHLAPEDSFDWSESEDLKNLGPKVIPKPDEESLPPAYRTISPHLNNFHDVSAPGFYRGKSAKFFPKSPSFQEGAKSPFFRSKGKELASSHQVPEWGEPHSPTYQSSANFPASSFAEATYHSSISGPSESPKTKEHSSPHQATEWPEQPNPKFEAISSNFPGTSSDFTSQHASGPATEWRQQKYRETYKDFPTYHGSRILSANFPGSANEFASSHVHSSAPSASEWQHSYRENSNQVPHKSSKFLDSYQPLSEQRGRYFGKSSYGDAVPPRSYQISTVPKRVSVPTRWSDAYESD